MTNVMSAPKRVAVVDHKAVPAYDISWVLNVPAANPKAARSGAYLRYAAYSGCATVGDFIAAYKKLPAGVRGSATAGSCLSWDLARGLIAVAAPKAAAK